MTKERVAQPEPFRDEELLADVICRLIGDARHIAVGAASPIPATAALLAREHANLHNLAKPYLSLLGSQAHAFFTDGSRELFDCAGQGRIDVFFLSGGQIDGEGNINLVSVGDYEKPKARFPGSFGSAYLYYVVPRVILFRTEHSRRTLVPKVDFISAPGAAAPTMWFDREGRSRSSPIVACLSSIERNGAFVSRAFIPATASRRSSRIPVLPSIARRRCRPRPRRAPIRCA